MKTKLTRFFVVLIIAVCVFIGANCTFGEADLTFSGASETRKEVYLAGKPIGVEIGAEGVIIAGTTGVVTSKGMEFPLDGLDVHSGDLLLSVAGITVNRPQDITTAMKKLPAKKVIIKIKRGQNVFDLTVNAAVDVLSGEYRLGLSVKDDITGVGTLTFVTKNGKFGALGHHIADLETGLNEELKYGKIFDCEITGVKRASDGRAGELVGSFDRFNEGIGEIYVNNDFGIFGEYYGTDTFNPIFTAGAEEIKHGKAYIYTCVSGDKPRFYTIDIIKTYPQETAATKSMVISVTDKRLIEQTGGIVQGMSGSPIVQDGKLIGAVTHVFIGDATKGYAVYIDWMLQNAS